MNDIAPGEVAIQVLGPKNRARDGQQAFFLYWNQDGRLMGARFWGHVSAEAKNLRGHGWRVTWLPHPFHQHPAPETP